MWKVDRQDHVVERRQCRRLNIPLCGRLMLSDRREFECRVFDMSLQNVYFETDADGRMGERIVAYIDHVGRIEGRIVRIAQNGFAMELAVPSIKQHKLSLQLWKLGHVRQAGVISQVA